MTPELQLAEEFNGSMSYTTGTKTAVKTERMWRTHTPNTARTLFVAIAFGVVALSGCNATDKNTVDVFAAASLTDAFTAIAADFEKTHPGVNIRLSFAGSQTLRTQIQHGADAHVFASANHNHMAALRRSKLVNDAIAFANNDMVIVVPPGNPAGVDSLATLPRARRIVLAGASVPAGAYAQRMLRNASKELGADFNRRVIKHVVSREQHVRQTLQKVVIGEADAAIVYASDAASAGTKIKIIRIPSRFNVTASYPIATVGSASTLARKFVEYVRSEAGRNQLQKHGFRPPPAQTAMMQR